MSLGEMRLSDMNAPSLSFLPPAIYPTAIQAPPKTEYKKHGKNCADL